MGAYEPSPTMQDPKDWICLQQGLLGSLSTYWRLSRYGDILDLSAAISIVSSATLQADMRAIHICREVIQNPFSNT